MKKQEDYFMAAKVTDLRSALKMLEDMPGQLIETDVEVEPMAELSGVYRHVGAGGTVIRKISERNYITAWITRSRRC